MVMFASFLRLVVFSIENVQVTIKIFFPLNLIYLRNSGLRWTLSQMVMQKSEMGLANPIDMMYHIQPWMIVTLLPFAMAFEGI